MIDYISMHFYLIQSSKLNTKDFVKYIMQVIEYFAVLKKKRILRHCEQTVKKLWIQQKTMINPWDGNIIRRDTFNLINLITIINTYLHQAILTAEPKSFPTKNRFAKLNAIK